jgi:hypothetical protein
LTKQTCMYLPTPSCRNLPTPSCSPLTDYYDWALLLMNCMSWFFCRFICDVFNMYCMTWFI